MAGAKSSGTAGTGSRGWAQVAAVQEVHNRLERGEFDDDVEAANLLEQYEARIAALERMVGRFALENDLLKSITDLTPAERWRAIRDHRPRGLSVAQGCRLMAVARSTFYDRGGAEPAGDIALVERMHAIQDEFPACGYRRITAQLGAEGMLVKPQAGRAADAPARHAGVPTTDSDHDGLTP